MTWINMLSPLQWALLLAIPPAILSLYFLKLKRHDSVCLLYTSPSPRD